MRLIKLGFVVKKGAYAYGSIGIILIISVIYSCGNMIVMIDMTAFVEREVL